MADNLQFDKADFGGAAALSCASCNSAIAHEYYQANGRSICAACREKVAQLASAGSTAARLARAISAGLVAALGGFLLYWAILAIANFELSLIAIVVGWMVGAAVRWGSGHRGGIAYQLVAVALTYASICAAYVPNMVSQYQTEGPFVLKLIFAIVFSWLVPWYAGFSNIIGWVIIAIGLWQAWSMNRKTTIEMRGPFKVATGPGAAP